MSRDEKPEKVNLNALLDDEDDDEDEDDDDYRPSDDEDAAGLSLTEMISGKLSQAQRFHLSSLGFNSGEDHSDTEPTQSGTVDEEDAPPTNVLLQLTDDKKKRADELWAELNMLSRPKKTTPTQPTTKNTMSITTPASHHQANVATTDAVKVDSKAAKSNEPIETIKKVTKVYDFAGESVVVEEEQTIRTQTSGPVSTGSNDLDKSINSGRTFVAPPKRSSGLGSLVSSLTKKPKMSTLNKTKLDWEGYKKDEGLEDELRNHRKNKDNFVDRQAFLQRTDLKQFEKEKAIREKQRLTQSK